MSRSSIPNRHFTEIGVIGIASFILFIHWYTREGYLIKQAPNDPACTLGLGQPTLRLI